MPEWLKSLGGIIMGALAAGGALFGVGRYVGNIETRIHQLEERANRSEQRGKYFHGEVDPRELERSR